MFISLRMSVVYEYVSYLLCMYGTGMYTYTFPYHTSKWGTLRITKNKIKYYLFAIVVKQTSRIHAMYVIPYAYNTLRKNIIYTV